MAVKADHPDYDPNEIDNPDDYKPSFGGTSFRANELKGIPILVYAASVRASTLDDDNGNAKKSDYVVFYGRFLDPAMRLSTKDGNTVNVELGEPFSSSTGAKMIVPVFKTGLARGTIRDVEATEYARGIIGRISQGKATKGNPPLLFTIATPDEQVALRAALAAVDAEEAAE